jgi:hypothetical protein
MPSLKNLREELSRNNSIVAGIEQSFKRQQAWTGRHPTPPLGQGWDGRTHGTKRCETRRQAGSLLRLGRDGLVQVQKKRHHCRSVAAVCEKPCRRKYYCTPTPWACTAVGLRARAASSETSQPAGLRSITSAHHIGCLILCESQSVVVSPALRSLKKGSCSRSCAGGDGRRMQMQMQGI